MTGLVDSLDEAARLLLRMATGPEKDEAGNLTPVTLAERTKAFDSVVDWVKVKQTVAPPPAEPSKFEALRSKYNGAGAANKRRGNAAKNDEAAPEGGDIDVSALNGGGLFG